MSCSVEIKRCIQVSLLILNCDRPVSSRDSYFTALLSQWQSTGQGLMGSKYVPPIPCLYIHSSLFLLCYFLRCFYRKRSGIDAASKLRPSPAELSTMGPAFNDAWTQHFANVPLKPVIWLGMGSMCVFIYLSISILFYFVLFVYTYQTCNFAAARVKALKSCVANL